MKTPTSVRVLLVEDQPLLAQVIKGLLAQKGFTVDTAENGSAAVAELRVTPYDLVISDLMMPVMDGVQLLEWIRLEAAMTVPVIVLSANRDARLTKRLEELGVRAVLRKPLDMDHFAATVTALLDANA